MKRNRVPGIAAQSALVPIISSATCQEGTNMDPEEIPVEVTLEILLQEIKKIKHDIGDLARDVREVKRIASQIKR
jgi:hypothetical protein